MNEFLKMDIFFFVTTLLVIVLGICAGYVTWRFQRILKNIEHISEQVAQESDTIREDLAEMRSDVKRGKGRIRALFGFLKKSGSK
jgi:CHASE3 domain sensor protein